MSDVVWEPMGSEWKKASSSVGPGHTIVLDNGDYIFVPAQETEGDTPEACRVAYQKDKASIVDTVGHSRRHYNRFFAGDVEAPRQEGGKWKMRYWGLVAIWLTELPPETRSMEVQEALDVKVNNIEVKLNDRCALGHIKVDGHIMRGVQSMNIDLPGIGQTPVVKMTLYPGPDPE